MNRLPSWSRTRPAAAVLLSMGLLVAACGSTGSSSAPPASSAPTAAASASGGADLGAPEKTDLKIGYRTNDAGNPAAIMIAIEKGYFKDEGLTVEPVLIDDVDAALIGGSLDLAIFDPDGSANHINEGVPIRMVAGWRDKEAMIIFAGKGINTVADLAGKDVALGLGAGDPATKIRTDALKAAGWDLESANVNFVNPPGFSNARIQLLLEGKLAMTYGFPRHRAQVTDAGGTIIVDELNEEMSDVVIAKQDFIDANQNTLARTFRALIKAKDFLLDPNNKDAVIEIVKKYDVPAEPKDIEPWDAQLVIHSQNLSLPEANLDANLKLAGVTNPGFDKLTDLRALRAAWAAMGITPPQ